MKYNIVNILKYVRPPIALLMLMLCSMAVMADGNLINYVTSPQMNEDQLHYYGTESGNKLHVEQEFATINFEVLKGDQITVNLYNGLNLTFEKEDRLLQEDPLRKAWVGRVPTTQDYVHIVANKSESILVANITVDGYIYAIRPLSGGLHLVVRVDPGKEEPCQAHEGMEPSEVTHDPDDKIVYDPGNADLLPSQQGDASRATGECLIRVMVPYTDDADAALADILSDINNLINIANTGYNNSGVNFNIELAASFEVIYTEVNINTSLDDLTDNTIPVLTDRQLWDADQVALITAGGSGLAWVNIAYNRQYSVTGIGNFNVFTFHHELGHNGLCTHAVNQSSQPGTAPYAGYGHPSGCFRTIMAYSDACGASPCTRFNWFSDNLGVGDVLCGGVLRLRGNTNARNTDRLNLSRGTIVDHEIVPATRTYSGDYNWFAREAVHFVATSSVTYNSSGTNKFEFWSGSEGSFRASDEVTLGEGFHARFGTDFTAYLENCTPIPTPNVVIPEDAEREVAEDFEHNPEENIMFSNDMSVFPNPFSTETKIEITLSEDQVIRLAVYDVNGKVAQVIVDGVQLPEGRHIYSFDATSLPAGVYNAVMTIDNQRMVRRAIKLDN